MDELRDSRDHPETTVGTIRSRLRRFAANYADVYDREGILAPLVDVEDRPAEIERAMAVFDVLDEELDSDVLLWPVR